ncbi:MAG: ABC transporter permease [Nitrososphaerota archaeon]|nr:ABC transporter permease [Candidatus Calditenuaceae archaeon]MDW8073181.1 ABC transporter permease [Nitrososphaerota archaeon]
MKKLIASISLGLERELGWTFPPLVVLLGTIPATASVLIVVMIYWVGSSAAGAVDPSWIAFLVVGASLYTHFSSYIWAPISAVSEGKASYTYPLVFIAHSSLTYVTGRVIASFIESSFSAILALGLSTVAIKALLGVEPTLSFTPLSIALFALGMLVGLLAALGLGLMLAAYAIFVTRLEWGLPVYISGILMIFSEAIFPTSALPPPLHAIAESLPFTHIIRAARAALIGPPALYSAEIATASLLSATWFLAGVLVYAYSEGLGRRRGYIDLRVT